MDTNNSTTATQMTQHPAYQYTLRTENWTREEREAFVVYSNRFRGANNEFSRPMGEIVSYFRDELSAWRG